MLVAQNKEMLKYSGLERIENRSVKVFYIGEDDEIGCFIEECNRTCDMYIIWESYQGPIKISARKRTSYLNPARDSGQVVVERTRGVWPIRMTVALSNIRCLRRKLWLKPLTGQRQTLRQGIQKGYCSETSRGLEKELVSGVMAGSL